MKDPIPPKLRLLTTHLLRRAGDKAAEVAGKHMEDACGLTTREWGVLHLIHDHPQSQQEIANALGIDASAMVKVVDSLEKRNCLKRTANPDDRRQHLLKITPKGLTAYRDGMKAVTSMNEELFSALTAEELKAFHAALLKILD